jgi:hypothetical protein
LEDRSVAVNNGEEVMHGKHCEGAGYSPSKEQKAKMWSF